MTDKKSKEREFETSYPQTGNRAIYLALSFSVYASVNLPSLMIIQMNPAMIATESAVLTMSPVNNRPIKGCATLPHLWRDQNPSQ